MQLNISNEYELLIKARAHAAGFEDRVGEYLVRLVTQDAETGKSDLSTWNLQNLSSEEITQFIDDGYSSGIAGEMNQAYFDRLRDDLQQQN